MNFSGLTRLRWNAVLLVALIALPSYADVKLRFEANAVVATGLTAGAKTVWMDVALDAVGYHSRVIDRSTVLTDDDGDGVVRFEVPKGVKTDSVWAVVDMTSGNYVVDTPAPGPIRHEPLPAAAVHRKDSGHAADVEGTREAVVVWCVRPGIGAWKALVADGEADDADHASNGKTRAAIASMQKIDGVADAPDDFKGGDVIVMVDLLDIEAFDARIEQ
jgi:hypothetical protein